MDAPAPPGRYRLVDEPSPSPLSQWATKPLWPLLGGMLGGAWLGLPWLVLNAFALGSPTRRREALLAVAGFLGALAIAALVLAIDKRVDLGRRGAAFAVLSISAWKLGIYYSVHVLQSRTYALREYFQGPAKSGVIGVVAGAALRGTLLAKLPLLLKLVLS